jgi:hypothetical protein
MMTSHSELDIKRQWSIIPVRALMDRKLHTSHFRVLAGLCIFTNSHGVCWPGVQTVADIVGVDPASISRSIARLVKAGYVRRLRPQDYQMEYAQFGKINRYQVLYDVDAPLPTWEEVQSAKLLLSSEDAGEAHKNEIGGVGEDDALIANAHSLASAYAATVERVLGQPRRAENELGAARQLAAMGVDVPTIIKATEDHCRVCLLKRAGVPALADVGRALN